MKLPVISGYDTIKTLRKAGFVVTRQKFRREKTEGETAINSSAA